ncbi:MAG TPA: DUF1801 domain-containing protein [Thermoplasmata archaeon]|nr:DUF1801 domain-containing protein [Thermoplasmata archaeon]
MRRDAPPPASVAAYLAEVPSKSRKEFARLRRTIRAAAPEAEEVISYRMPALRQNGIVVYYGAFEDHCSLFVASPSVRHGFSAELKPFESGKGTLRSTPGRPIPAALVTRIVKARLAENAARKKC